MQLTLNREGSIPLYQQISYGLRLEIRKGSLLPGDKLPPERVLAKQLNVNRTTILSAYQELKADGLIASVVGSGTIVQPVSEWLAAERQLLDLPRRLIVPALAKASLDSEADMIAGLLRRPANPSHISFTVGKPAVACTPVRLFQQLQYEVVEEMGEDVFLHSPVEGSESLRESIGGIMRGRGVQEVASHNLMIVSGAQQALDLIARSFIDPGDVVLVEEPSYFSAVQLFRQYGARIVALPSTVDGKQLEMGIVEAMLLKYKPKFIYVMPTFQNPTGRVLPLQQRLQLVDIASRSQTLIVEEDPYYEMRYEGEAIPSLKALDKMGYVIHIGSFSKLLAPGLRVGWIQAAPDVMDVLLQWKPYMDLHTNHAAQLLVDRFIRKGHWDNHLQQCRELYLDKRNYMLKLLQKRSDLQMDALKPEGGYFLWLRIPARISPTALLVQALELDVSFVPGTYFTVNGDEKAAIRLNFTRPEKSEMKEGLERLFEVMERMNQQKSSSQPPRFLGVPLV